MAAFNTVMSMAHPPIDTIPPQLQRPSMRRKSSAQNLLSSFKPGSNALPSLPYAATPTTPMAPPPPPPAIREWDAQSLASDSAQSSAGMSVASGAPLLPGGQQGASVEILREVVRKRIITLTYLRNVHDGRSHWFHTIMVTRTDLDRAFNNIAMKARTYRFAVLGMSLAHSFDMKDPQDLLRALTNSLNEYDQNKDEGDKSKVRGLFRTGKGKRQAGAVDYAMSYSEASETSFLVLPHVPFPLDYHQTLLSLLDVLSEVYHKISKILGPSPFLSSGQHMTGPLGLLSPHPGVSYLFAGVDVSFNGNDHDGSLWGIAHAQSTMNNAGGMGSPPPSWNSTLADSVRQVDGRLKKLIAMLLKELDDLARANIREELASLDPLLRNVTIPDDPRDLYDFD